MRFYSEKTSRLSANLPILIVLSFSLFEKIKGTELLEYQSLANNECRLIDYINNCFFGNFRLTNVFSNDHHFFNTFKIMLLSKFEQSIYRKVYL